MLNCHFEFLVHIVRRETSLIGCSSFSTKGRELIFSSGKIPKWRWSIFVRKSYIKLCNSPASKFQRVTCVWAADGGFSCVAHCICGSCLSPGCKGLSLGMCKGHRVVRRGKVWTWNQRDLGQTWAQVLGPPPLICVSAGRSCHL